MSCASLYGRSSRSMSRRKRLYGGWTVSTGRIALKAATWAVSKLETPTWRTFPSVTNLAMADAVSSNGVAGSGQWIWKRST